LNRTRGRIEPSVVQPMAGRSWLGVEVKQSRLRPRSIRRYLTTCAPSA
jgi:hypothetical protein